MYQAIERHGLVRAPDADAQVAVLRRALEESAEELNSRTDGSPEDRNARAKIYRGLLAASRIIAQLREDALNG
jgi:hypothetical protein